MSIITKFFGKKKSISTTDPYLSLLLGNVAGQVGKPYKDVPNIYNPVKAVIDNISQAGIKLEDPDGNAVEWSKQPDVFKLFNSVTDYNDNPYTFAEFLQWFAGYHALYGEVFLLRVIETDGQRAKLQLPSQLKLIDPKVISEVINVRDGVQYVTGWQIGGTEYGLDEVIQIKDFNPYNSVRGLSPLDTILDQIKIENSASKTTVGVLQNDSTPGLILETEKNMNAQQRIEIKKAWESRHKGSLNSGKVAVLEGGLKANRLGFSNNDMQFIELMNMVDEKLIGAWRAPKAMFGMTDDLNYATFLGQLRMFWTMTLIPMLNRYADAFNKEIVAPYSAGKVVLKFDTSNIEALQDNINDFADSITKLTAAGFTRNEINKRFKLGFEDKPWGDEWWVPFSQVPAGSGSIADQFTTEPQKSVKKKSIEINGRQYTESQVKFIKNFNNLHDSLHLRFKSAVRTFFNGQRKRVLDAFDEQFKNKTVTKAIEINMNWLRETELYAESTEPNEREAMEQGVETGEETTGLSASQRIEYNISAATVSRLEQVSSEIIRTTKKQINNEINLGVEAGETTFEIKNRIKKYYNKIDNRADTIARTEITAQLNGGLLLQYDDVGVEKKEWLTNIDGFEREAHAMANHQTVKINEPFIVDGEGLMTPGGIGGSPGNVINCRCTVLPSV